MYKRLLPRIPHFHLGRVIGMGLFALSLFFYRSPENRPILGLWSYPFLVIIILSTLLFIIASLNAWRLRKKTYQGDHSGHSGIFYLDLALLFWGMAYFISVTDDSQNSGRIIDLNFFGSIMPVAVCLEWISLVMFLIAAFLFVSSLHKTKCINILLMLGTIVGVLLLGEGIIRFKAVFFPRTQGVPTYTSAIWKSRYVKLNNDGFRDVEHSLTKVPKTHRLLVVGDSFAFGWGIKSIEDRFSSQIGEKLITKTKEQWEVINVSRNATHTLEHIEFLKQALIYKPDIVILLYSFNDINYLHNVSPLKFPSAFSLKKILFKNSYLFQEVFVRIYRISFLMNPEKYDLYSDHTLLSHHLQDISKFVKLARQSNAFVRIVPFETGIPLGDSFRNRYRNFVNAAAAAKIPTWSLESSFSNLQFSQIVVNNQDSHPNELANFIAAEEIADQLLKEFHSEVCVLLANSTGIHVDNRAYR